MRAEPVLWIGLILKVGIDVEPLEDGSKVDPYGRLRYRFSLAGPTRRSRLSRL